MKSLPTKFFGSSGIPCLFANSEGTPIVGYLHRQLGDYRFMVTDGSQILTCFLCQTSEQVASYTSSLPVGYFTILVGLEDGPIEFIRKITADRCVTISNIGYQWHNADPTSIVAGIITPSLGENFLLLEGGGFLLQENGGFIILETA